MAEGVSDQGTYALLIYRTCPEPSAGAVARALKGHRAVQKQAAAAGGLHAVARLEDPEHARSVRFGESAHDITDGPYVEAKEWLVGFYLVDCESEAQALEYAQQLCPIPNHAIEVRPVGWRWKP